MNLTQLRNHHTIMYVNCRVFIPVSIGTNIIKITQETLGL